MKLHKDLLLHSAMESNEKEKKEPAQARKGGGIMKATVIQQMTSQRNDPKRTCKTATLITRDARDCLS